nr:hypothetical protein [bacterium]
DNSIKLNLTLTSGNWSTHTEVVRDEDTILSTVPIQGWIEEIIKQQAVNHFCARRTDNDRPVRNWSLVATPSTTIDMRITDGLSGFTACLQVVCTYTDEATNLFPDAAPLESVVLRFLRNIYQDQIIPKTVLSIKQAQSLGALDWLKKNIGTIGLIGENILETHPVTIPGSKVI